MNGTVPDTQEFTSVVSIAGPTSACSGTYIHPNFVLTAAHCLPHCSAKFTTACVDGADEGEIIDGSTKWVGRDGPLTATVCDGPDACGSGDFGNRNTADSVFFPRSSDFFSRSAPPDVAILHVITPFRDAPPIMVMPAIDLPSPSNLVSRYELTRPMIAGFSNNNTSAPKQRRVGIAEVENDIEMDGRAFKVDGDGRPFVGSRACNGDSGGPALWRDGSGLLTLGGVLSYTDEGFGAQLLGTACPSAAGETGVAFVPRPFIDRTLSSLTVTVRGDGTGSVGSKPSGIACTGDGSGCFEQVDLGTVVTLTAVAGPNSLFQGWSGACAGTANTCTVTVSTGLRVIATFPRLQQPLTVRVDPPASGNGVRVNPPNTVCTGVCTRSNPYGTNVALTAVPAPGFVFSKWSGACAGAHSTTCNLQMTAAQTAGASFCAEGDACCLDPANCQTCTPKQCPHDFPDCCS